MRAAITKNTIMLVGSAPTFPQGVIDDIETIGAMGAERDIPVHVDCCLGGYLLPFWTKLGYITKPYDYRVEGVTSISSDIHKYGLGPKGTSIISFVHSDYRKHMFFTSSAWTGGFYASPTMTGSRPGGVIAGAYASFLHLGESGFLRIAEQIHKDFVKVVEGYRL